MKRLLLQNTLFPLRRLSFGLVFLSFLSSTHAEIYLATSEAGVKKWSTQALDTSYTKTSIQENQPAQVADLLYLKRLPTKTSTILSKSAQEKLVVVKKLIYETSNKYEVNPELVEALIAVESGFDTQAISPKGARGLMQLMPATALLYGTKNLQDLHIPAKNVDIGVRHLKDLLKLHNGQIPLAIASYNAGQSAVAKHGQRIPGYRETMIYVPAVLAYMARGTVVNQDIQPE
jgi:soluble lytic murein transglycosylase-like protein